MGVGDTHRWGIGAWSPRLFLVAGGLLVFYGAFNGLEAFTDVAVPANVFETGYVFGFLGLLGLYPTLADEEPRLALVGAVAGAMGLVGVVLVSLRSFGHLAGLGPRYPAGWGLVVALLLIGFVGGFLAIGVAALRSAAYPRRVGLAVLLPGVIVVVMLLHMAAGLDRPATVFVISSGQAMAHLAIGATLRQQAADPGDDEHSDEAVGQVATDD